jgi:hypothetical protein
VADGQFIGYDPSKPAGERLAPEVRTEIAYVAPSGLTPQSVVTLNLKDENVTTAKLAPDAVDDTKLADNAVKREHLADAAVGTDEVEDGAITPAKTGTGVVTAVDSSDNPLQWTEKVLSSTEYNLIVTPDPNTTYFIHD